MIVRYGMTSFYMIANLFSQMSTFAFILNLDWFQLFKHIHYCVGAIYFSVLNLPCHICY